MDGSGWRAAGTNTGVSKTGGVAYTFDTNGNSTGTTDTVGRPYLPGNGLQYYDSQGNLRTISITYESLAVSTSLCGNLAAVEGGTCVEYSTTWNVPHIITLPDGLKYTIEYIQNAEAEISSITLPTGAVISYNYTQAPFGYYGGKRVSKRTVTVNGQSSVWTYSDSTPGPTTTTPQQISLTDPTGAKTVTTCSSYEPNLYSYNNNAGETGFDSPCEITKEQYYDASGTLIKTVDTYFGALNGSGAAGCQSTGDANTPLPTCVVTTWNVTNQVSKVETDYETLTVNLFPQGSTGPQSGAITWGNVQEMRAYDWGAGSPGSLLRRTTHSYLHTDTSVNPNSNRAAYLAANIANRPTAEIVKDGSGNIISQTKLYYDQFALQSTSSDPAVQHDYTNYGVSGTLRGNLTTESHWNNVTGAWFNTTYTYDDLGNRLTKTDPVGQGLSTPAGHQTLYSYADSFSGSSCNQTTKKTYAFPTETKQVVGTQSYRTRSTYYQCTGQVQSTLDENDIEASRLGTTFTYDLLNRPLTTTHEDGGTITLNYNGDALPLTVTRTTAIDSTKSHSDVTVTDGLGRVIQTQAQNPEGTVYVDTTYDSLSRVFTVSNPHLSSTSASDGLSTYAYDLFGRQVTLTHPDNSVLTTSYTGTASMTTDEGNGNGTTRVQRVVDSDGLGRLTSVCEVSGNTQKGSTGNTPSPCGQAIAMTGFKTTYAYSTDSSGYSYTTGSQTGLSNRTFKYDSLGRLLLSFNPETGNTTYHYDSDGLEISRTRPKENDASTSTATVTTTYSYDTLHRLTGEAYTVDATGLADANTPSNSYCYDETVAWGRTLTNTMGRKTRALVGTTCSSTSGTYTAGESFSYDLMGRVLANDQCTPGSCGVSHSSLDYPTYDYLGNGLSSSDGVGHTYSVTTDGAGRLSSASSNLTSGTLIANIAYGPIGMASADFGAAVHEAMTFQNRGWMQSISDSKQSPGSGDYPVGKINFTGTEQSYVTNGSATASTAALTVAGGGQQKKVYSADCSCFIFVVNSTQLYLTVGGYTVSAVSNSNTDTAANMASQFAAGLNQSGSPVTATLSGVNLTLTSKATGTAANYSISSTSTYDTTDFNAPAFSFSALPAAMAGGTGGPTTVYDQGTVSITVGGHTTHASWGSSDTPLTVASNVAAAINADSGANVTASAWSGQLTVTSRVAGGSGTYSYSVSTSPGTGFTSASFTGTAIGTTLTAAAYTVSMNRASNGDVIGSNDSVNGVWSYAYDEFNRLTSASRPAIGSSPAQSMTWDYDRYGNRWDQNILAGSGIASHPTFTGGNNRVDSSLYTYDPAGNLRNDGVNTYTYDAEGRIFQVGTTKYAYDADGLRVAKYSGSTLTNQYLYNLGSQAVAELNGSGTWVRTEIYAEGTYIGTYDNSSGTPVLTYAFGDWLGTLRARTGTTGAQTEANMSLPFGDSLATSGTESSHKHFTGKLHDDETGLDYFGARYYSGGQGRFLTPDWSASPQAVPYGHFETPQTLNLYAYVGNNPVTDTDPDGHATQQAEDNGFQPADSDWALSGSDKFAAGPLRIVSTTYTEFGTMYRVEECGFACLLKAWVTPEAQQTYGRQPDGSYKADPARVKAALDAKKPIHEPGNPDKSSECVFACKNLAEMQVGTSSWTKGKPALELNNTTDVGLAIATLGSGSYPSEHGNSGIYMGRDANGGVMIVDQWPNNGPAHDHPNQHTLIDGSPNLAMNPAAYYVIVVPKP